jgi:ABC-type bacteriocin/lantibiotic exporter with double-glycine peptidase domain
MTSAFLPAGFFATAGGEDSISIEELDQHLSQIRREENLCGPRAAWYCLRRMGRPVNWREVLGRCRLGDDGMSLEDLQKLLASFEVPARGLVGGASRLDSLPVPCLLVTGSRHCIVLEGIDKANGEATFFEPARGKVITAPLAILEAQCSGEAIVFDETAMSPAAHIGYVSVGAIAVIVLWWIAGRVLLRRRAADVQSPPSSPVVPPGPAAQ